MNLLYLAVKNVKRKPSRSIVLAFSIAISVSLLIFTLSFMMSVTATLSKISDRMGADLLVVPQGARTAAEEFLLGSKKTFYMEMDVLEKIRSFEAVDRVTYQTYLLTIPGVCCGIYEAQVIAFDQATDFIVSPWLKKSLDRELRAGEVIVGYQVNEDLNLLDVETYLFATLFKVVGVLEETGTPIDSALFMRDEDVRKIIRENKLQIKPDRISVIFVKLKRGYDPELVGREIEGGLLEVDVIPRGKIGEGLKESMLDLSKIFSITILLLAALSLFLAWSVFSAIVNERRREAGIIRSIGATRGQLLKIFLLEALLIGIAGSAAGVIGGNLLTNFLSGKFSLLATLSISLDALTAAGISLVSFTIGIGICILGALFPVFRISRMEPLMAIKEE